MNGQAQFYYYGQLPIHKDIKSLIYVFKDERADAPSIEGFYFVLFNYDLNDQWISQIDLASATVYTSYRICEAYWSGNSIELYELDYPLEGLSETSDMIKNGSSYLKLGNVQVNQDASTKYLDSKHIPYANKRYTNGGGNVDSHFCRPLSY